MSLVDRLFGGLERNHHTLKAVEAFAKSPIPFTLRLAIIIGKGRVVPIQLILLDLSEGGLPAHGALHLEQRLRLFALPPAALTAGKAEFLHGFGLDLDAVAGSFGGDVEAVFDGCWVFEVLVERVNVF